MHRASHLVGSKPRLIGSPQSSDHLGSTTKTVDASGNEVDLLRYATYGETRQGGANTPTDVRYTGQTLDLSTGLYWYASRPYNPVLGRFTQPDTIVPDPNNPQALNRYGYGLNNPLKYTDPTGHWYDWDGNWYDDQDSDATGDVTDVSNDAESGDLWAMTWDPSVPPVEITYTQTIRDDFDVIDNIPEIDLIDLEGARPYFDMSFGAATPWLISGGFGDTLMLDSDESYFHYGGGVGNPGGASIFTVGVQQSPGGLSASGFVPIWPVPFVFGVGPAASLSLSSSGISGVGGGLGAGFGHSVSLEYHVTKRLR